MDTEVDPTKGNFVQQPAFALCPWSIVEVICSGNHIQQGTPRNETNQTLHCAWMSVRACPFLFLHMCAYTHLWKSVARVRPVAQAWLSGMQSWQHRDSMHKTISGMEKWATNFSTRKGCNQNMIWGRFQSWGVCVIVGGFMFPRILLTVAFLKFKLKAIIPHLFETQYVIISHWAFDPKLMMK